jgi:hypothetical protein
MQDKDFFLDRTRLLYDPKIKALRHSFKEVNKANDAFVIYDCIFREMMVSGKLGVDFTNDFVGDIADLIYEKNSFVLDVVRECLELGLFRDDESPDGGRTLFIGDCSRIMND